MTEKLLQYIWQFQHFNRDGLVTDKSEVIQVIHPGQLNHNQGPDFLDARIKIGNTILAGSVELHLKTSDWHKHNHSNDINYKNVILHVVYKNDEPRATILPLLELESRISNLLLQKYEQLMVNNNFIACSNSISGVKELTWIAWKDRLLAERLTRKSKKVFEFLEQTNYHWEETFWWLLAGNFGIKVNTDAFEELAKSIPINILTKNKTQIHQVEALLFGQANLLNSVFKDDYLQLLQKEYEFLKKKYNLKPIHTPVHFLRMRPGNFPTVRLAQLSMLVCNSSHLFSKILEATAISEIIHLLSITANDYWHYHYQLDEISDYKPKKLGENMINNVIINTVVPMLFAYGMHHKNEEYKNKALQWMSQLRAETNTITAGFKNIQLQNKNAFDSQCYIELKTQYCDSKRCLECAVGNGILKF